MTQHVLSPWRTGIKCVCPHCGRGKLFKGFLEFNLRCDQCDTRFDNSGSGDGPAFFVMFAIAILITPPVLVTQIVFDPPVWVQTLVWGPVILAGSVGLLRPFKATLFALEAQHRPKPVDTNPKHEIL